MEYCDHDPSYMEVPPPTQKIATDYPDVVPNMLIDRNFPRCKYCDMSQAEDREYMAKQGSQVDSIDNWIQEMEDKEGRNGYDQRLWQQKRVLATRNLYAAIFLAWQPFWAIWGKPLEQARMTFPR
ncbi:hypothetical protein GQ53DRAFT_826275 [Thozetella sp. PMI_491]|nr:hypothetical protein GQ53DRAFT_826275 [Thozetella sp. PMI_491]